MQLASKGPGLFGARTGIGTHIRSVHVHVPRHPPPPIPSGTATTTASSSASSQSTLTSRFVQSTRTAFTRFFAHLTTPGFSHPVAGYHSSAQAASRRLSSRVNASIRPGTIQQGLSPAASHTLRRGTTAPKGPFLPRASPASKPGVFQVGLGTARNFSTARPLFQNLVQNVPIAGRTVYEADWDLEKKMVKEKRRFRASKQAKEKKEGAAAVRSPMSLMSLSEKKKGNAEELEKYFLEQPVSVTTVLIIPLAPTPTARVPLYSGDLDSYRSGGPRLFNPSELEANSYAYSVHALRLSSLFSRLDANRVWERGVKSSAHGDPRGLCTVLRVEFGGWTEGMVKELLGDAGRGWCKIVEVREGSEELVDKDENGIGVLLGEGEGEDEMSSVLSAMTSSASSPLSSSLSLSLSPNMVDPSHSVVLPTLDFSASFTERQHSRGTRRFAGTTMTPPESRPVSPMWVNTNRRELDVDEGLTTTSLGAGERLGLDRLDLSLDSEDSDSDLDLDTDALSDTYSDMEMGSQWSGSDGWTEVSAGAGVGTSAGEGESERRMMFSSEFAMRSSSRSSEYLPRDTLF